jgi:acyl-CoA dehydrogenase
MDASFGWLSAAVAPHSSWLLCLLVLVALGFFGAPLYVWSAAVVVALWLLGVSQALILFVFGVLLLMNIPLLRRVLVTKPIMALMDKMKLMPVISETERVALEAGAVWVDAELFSGKPNFERIRKEPYNKLSADEQAFVDNQVKHVASLCSDWDIYQHKDLPPSVWDYLKKERFFGMIVPKEFGGHGFSALGQSEVVAQLATHSSTLCVTVMVPNSLGPAELLIHYGTPTQRQYYLPRLARGEEIPCFALTEPHAGSDAGSISSTAVVFRDTDGSLKMRLNWDKRYITLAAVSTLIGLAVKLKDPENLLGKGTDPGITCVLVPAKTPGVVLGRRHNPMGSIFYNCPTQGKDVVVSVDQIIGGPDGAGRGWQMLMECLAAGRSISLPSQSAGGSKGLLRLVSAYAVIRRQFGLSIGKFEGIEEPLARITGLTYLMEAARIFTTAAVDQGIKPAVVSAIAKYNQTELARKLVNDGMDVMGGAAISRGPRNHIANSYIGIPISITVEGANILTRSMIIFGQGAIRCHPFAYKEVKALMEHDAAAFDGAFWKHIGHVVRNACRSLVLSLTRGHFAAVPGGPCRRYYQKLSWVSASFAVMADVAMGSLGGSLKMREKLTGRYADVLSWMYLATSVIKRYEAEGFRKDHRDVFHWSMQYCFAEIQKGFDGIFANFDVAGLSPIFKYVFGFWSRLNSLGSYPADRLGHRIAAAVQVPGAFRDSLASGVLGSGGAYNHSATLEQTFKMCFEAQEIYNRIGDAVKAKTLPKKRPTALVKEALAAKVITEAEAKLLGEVDAARDDAIQVDSFALDEFESHLLDVKAPARA